MPATSPGSLIDTVTPSIAIARCRSSSSAEQRRVAGDVGDDAERCVELGRCARSCRPARRPSRRRSTATRRAPRRRASICCGRARRRALGHHRGGEAGAAGAAGPDRSPRRCGATRLTLTSGMAWFVDGDHGQAVGEMLDVRRAARPGTTSGPGAGGATRSASGAGLDDRDIGGRDQRRGLRRSAARRDRVLVRAVPRPPRADSGPRALASSRSQRRATRWMSAGVTAAIWARRRSAARGIAVDDHRLGDRGRLAVDGLAAAAARWSAIRSSPRCSSAAVTGVVAEAGDLAPQRRLAGLGGLAAGEDRIDGERAAAPA